MLAGGLAVGNVLFSLFALLFSLPFWVIGVFLARCAHQLWGIIGHKGPYLACIMGHVVPFWQPFSVMPGADGFG
jgi:hypothetical protein